MVGEFNNEEPKSESSPLSKNILKKPVLAPRFYHWVTILSFLVNFSFIILFYLRISHLNWIENYGIYINLLLIPGIVGLIYGFLEKVEAKILILYSFFFFFMILEFLFDYYLHLDFRGNWLLLTPYLVLYYIMNYSLVVIPWKKSRKRGIILLFLFLVQIGVNLLSH